MSRRRGCRGNTKRRKRLWNENPNCYWCGKLTSMTSKEGSHDFATVDHVVPRSKGGRNYYENTVLSCYDCNQKKGNRVNHSDYFEFLK